MNHDRLGAPIAVAGAGRVGQALARALMAKRYKIRFGVPDPARHAALAAQFKGLATVSGLSEAIEPAAIVILATP
jgi:predicted dinucleotide-binding enzyme